MGTSPICSNDRATKFGAAIVRWFAFLALLAFCATFTAAQGGFTTVSGVIVDPNGIPWVGGTISAQLITFGGAQPTLNGVSFTGGNASGIIGPGGAFLMRLADSGVIVPNTTQWRFTINISPGVLPPLGLGSQSFVVTTAINCATNTPAACAGNAMVITAALTPVPALTNLVGGGGGPPAGAVGDMQIKLNATTLAAGHINDNGTTQTVTEDLVTTQDHGYDNAEIAGAGGVAANTIVILDASNPSKVVTPGLGATGVLGITLSAAAPGASTAIVTAGDAVCIADNAVTAGHLLGVGTTTPGSCKDLGVATSNGVSGTVQIIGEAEANALAGALFNVHTYGPGHYGTIPLTDGSFIYATNYGAVPDARFNNDATTSNGSNLLNAPTLNCTAADVGKLAIVVKPVNNTYPFGTGLVTVLSCNSGTQAVLSANANANAGATQNWAIGTDNGAFLNAAATAAWNTTEAVAVPCGPMIVATPPFVTTASSNWAQLFNVTGCVGTVGSMFIAHPNITVGVAANGSFFYTNGAITGYVPVGGSMFDVTNIRLTSLSGAIPMAAGTMYAFKGGGASLRMHGVQIHDFYSANNANCTLISNATGEAFYELLNIQHFNCYAAALAGQGPNTLSNTILAYHSGGNQVLFCNSATCNLNSDYVTTTGPIQPIGSGSVINVNGGYYQDMVFSAGGSGQQLNLTGIVHSISAGGTASNIDTTNMVVYATNNKFINLSNATPNIFKGTGSVFDGGLNRTTITNGPVMNAATALFGSASITGTALVAGNVGLTSGWDTSTVTAVGAGSDSHKGTFTITVAGIPGPGPVITLTFPTPPGQSPAGYWVAPTYCSLQQIGGTLGVLTVPLNAAGTPTTTTVAFTLSGTAVAAQLYTFSYGCP